MGYEDRFLANLDRQRKPDDSLLIKQAHEKATHLIEDSSMNPADFIDLYGVDNVRSDEEYVQKLETKFEKNETQMTAEVLEAIFFEHSELSEWLGKNVETIKTSKYDDYVNGVDLVAEFDDGETSQHHLALAVDVTFGSTTLHSKFDRIRKEIAENQLAQIKYFQSHSFKGMLRQIPRVIIGVENDRVKELASLWNAGKRKELGEHPIRDLLLNQISMQMRTFLEVAEANHSDRALRSYRNAFQTIQAIRTERGLRDIGDLADDKVWLAIQQNLLRLKNNTLE